MSPSGYNSKETRRGKEERESWGAIESHTPIECGLRFSGETSDPRRPGVRPGQAGAAERRAAPEPPPHSHGQAGATTPRGGERARLTCRRPLLAKRSGPRTPGSVRPPSPGRRFRWPVVYPRTRNQARGLERLVNFPQLRQLGHLSLPAANQNTGDP